MKANRISQIEILCNTVNKVVQYHTVETALKIRYQLLSPMACMTLL